jgi:hypothetical protein
MFVLLWLLIPLLLSFVSLVMFCSHRRNSLRIFVLPWSLFSFVSLTMSCSHRRNSRTFKHQRVPAAMFYTSGCRLAILPSSHVVIFKHQWVPSSHLAMCYTSGCHLAMFCSHRRNSRTFKHQWVPAALSLFVVHPSLHALCTLHCTVLGCLFGVPERHHVFAT